MMMRLLLALQLILISAGTAFSANGVASEGSAEASHVLEYQTHTAQQVDQFEAPSNDHGGCKDLCHIGPCHWGHCSFLPSAAQRTLIPDLISIHGPETNSVLTSPDLDGLRRPPRILA